MILNTWPSVTLYKCELMGPTSCGSCLAADPKYDCVWCQLSKTGCRYKGSCERSNASYLLRNRDNCPDLEIREVSRRHEFNVVTTFTA